MLVHQVVCQCKTTSYYHCSSRLLAGITLVQAILPIATHIHSTICHLSVYDSMDWLDPTLHFPWVTRNPHLTQCVTRPQKHRCQMASKSISNSLSREHKCDRRQTDRPHYEDMCRNRSYLALQKWVLITMPQPVPQCQSMNEFPIITWSIYFIINFVIKDWHTKNVMSKL